MAIAQVDIAGRPINRRIDLTRRASPATATVVPVQLVVTSATEENTGDDATKCGYKYDLYTISADPETDTPLIEDVDPTEDGHHHQRPEVGQMIAATFGYAHQEQGGLKLGFVNEIMDAEACQEPEEEEPE